MSLELAHFKLYSITFELRFEPSYLLWDRAGRFAKAATELHPPLKLATAVPSNIVFNIERTHQLSLQMDRLTFTEWPSIGFQADDYAQLTHKFASLASSALELGAYARVGLRPVYTKKYKTRQEASEAVAQTGIVKIPTGKHFNIQGKASLPHYALRWEDEDLGITVNLRAQERELHAEPPFGEADITPIDVKIFEAVFDLDYYTMGSVPAEKFHAEEWIKKSLQVIKRDASVFLGE